MKWNARLQVAGNGAKLRGVVTAQCPAGVRSALPQSKKAQEQLFLDHTPKKDVAVCPSFCCRHITAPFLMPSSMLEPAAAAVALPTRPVRTVIRHSTIWSPAKPTRDASAVSNARAEVPVRSFCCNRGV